MAYKIEGMEVSGKYSPDYFSLWRNGSRLTGGSRLFKVFNYGVVTGEKQLTGNAVMVMFGPLIKWSKE